MSRIALLALVLPALLVDTPAWATEQGDMQEDIAGLKEARAEHPGDAQVARLLALAYLEAGNPTWALKTLLEQLGTDPDDLMTRTWVVWLLIQDGDLAQAQLLLDEAEVPETGPLARRVDLLQATLLELDGDPDAAVESLEAAGVKGEKLLPEDVELFLNLRSDLVGDPGHLLSARILLSGGYTTNAVQSAPQDVGAGLDEDDAAVTSLDLVLRLEPWVSPLVRPLAEVRLKGFLPATRNQEIRDFAYLSLGGRVGGELGRLSGLRGRLLYSYELLGLLDGGWYMTAHRAELELDVLPELQFFGGVGRRIYAHLPRTRTEMDLGIAVVLPFPGGWNLTWLAAARIQLARHEAFDARGATALVRLRIPLPLDFMIKLRAMALLDVFPSSAGYYDQDQDRKDLMLKTEVGAWSPAWNGLRLAVTYTLSHRVSTVDSVIDNFNFTDHRILLALRWEGSLDPTLPGKAKVGPDHVTLPYGLGDGGGLGLDRVQDLLRQEDAARRGSMCVD